MIRRFRRFSPDIWEFPRECIVYGIGSIGRGCILPVIMYCFSGTQVYMPTEGHVDVGHRWDRVAMDLLDMSVTTAKGNRYQR